MQDLRSSEKCELTIVSDHFEDKQSEAVEGILKSFYANNLGIRSTTLAE